MARCSVTVPPRIVAGLRRHAAATLPAECCGALVGLRVDDTLELRAMIPVDNQATDHRRYHIDARSVMRLERQAADAGVQLLGFYHSHSAGDASPSSLDLELACPGYVYVIVHALEGTVRAWLLEDDRASFAEIPVVVLAGAA